MANINEYIQVVGNTSWADLIDTADLMDIDISYHYPLDPEETDIQPNVDYPDGKIQIADSLDPVYWEDTDPTPVVKLGTYESELDNWDVYGYRQVLSQGPFFHIYGKIIYVLFKEDESQGGQDVIVNCVHPDDMIDLNGTYHWLPVASYIQEQEELP